MPDLISLDPAIADLRAMLEALSAGLSRDLRAYLDTVGMTTPDALIEALQDVVPWIAEPYIAAAVDYSTVWYDELSPGSPYRAELLGTPELVGGAIEPKRLAASISWAVHTVKDASVADKLSGTLDRAVHDASRKVVQHNAGREHVRYARHAAAGACAWCRLAAIRGAVFKTAASAVKGHDSCHCVAVPERAGTRFVPPPHYAAWEKQYADSTAALRADDKVPTLSNVLAAFRASDS
jgi:hypothetical protein